MLERLQSLARTLYPLRWLLAALALASLALFIALIARADPALDPWLLPVAALFGWLLSLSWLVPLYHQLPPPGGPGMGWWQRLKRRLHRALCAALGWLLVLASLALLLLGLRGVGMLL